MSCDVGEVTESLENEQSFTRNAVFLNNNNSAAVLPKNRRIKEYEDILFLYRG